MEILIVGALVVALMIYVSTRIKKSVATAFESEMIENEEFSIFKPQGFLCPINEQSKFAFEAYTKDFGQNDAEEFRQAQANLLVISDASFDAVIENIKKNSVKIASEKIQKNAPPLQKICLIESEIIEKGVPVKNFHKIVEDERQKKIYHLRASVLAAYQETFAERVNEMLESFTVK